MYMFLYFPYSNAQFPYILGSGFKGHKSHMLSNISNHERIPLHINGTVKIITDLVFEDVLFVLRFKFNLSSLTRNSSMNISFSMILI